MPKGILNAYPVGLFGKLPSTGDFVSRGLPAGLRPVIDRWLTARFAHRDQDGWPYSGYRGAFVWNNAIVSALVKPSRDKLGRIFPFSVCFVAPRRDLSVAGIDQWCDAALPQVDKALAGKISAQELLEQLHEIPIPQDAGDLPELPSVWPDRDISTG